MGDRVKPNLFIAQGESPIQTRQTDLTSHRQFTQATSPSSDTPSSTSFFAKLLVHVTYGIETQTLASQRFQ